MKKPISNVQKKVSLMFVSIPATMIIFFILTPDIGWDVVLITSLFCSPFIIFGIYNLFKDLIIRIKWLISGKKLFTEKKRRNFC